MAKTIDQWYDIIVAEYVAQMGIAGTTVVPSAWSVTNHQRIFLYVVATVMFTLGVLLDIFSKEVNDKISADKTHRPQWYVKKAKEFQYGFSLVDGEDYYDNTGIADSAVAVSKIIAYAAFVEEPFARMKLAKKVGNGLGKLDNTELLAATEYIKRFRDAGVKLHGATLSKPATITSTDPDKIKVGLRIIYDPLVLNETGARIDGLSATPVADGIRGYLSKLDFNGVFDIQKLQDAIQAVDGVVSLKIDVLQTKYGALPFTTVDINFVPDSGYLVMDDADLSITYILN